MADLLFLKKKNKKKEELMQNQDYQLRYIRSGSWKFGTAKIISQQSMYVGGGVQLYVVCTAHVQYITYEQPAKNLFSI